MKITDDISAAMNKLGNYASEVKKIIDVIAVSSGELLDNLMEKFHI